MCRCDDRLGTEMKKNGEVLETPNNFNEAQMITYIIQQIRSKVSQQT